MPLGEQTRTDIDVQQTQRDILAAFFKARELGAVCGPEDLIPIVGPNYRSRVSDCVIDLKMNIVNVPRYRHYLNAKGKPRRQRLIGGYQYLPYEPLGQSADVPLPDAWPAFDAPYQEPFALKP